jgi:hypothetical protein
MYNEQVNILLVFFEVSEKFLIFRQRIFAESVLRRLEEKEKWTNINCYKGCLVSRTSVYHLVTLWISWLPKKQKAWDTWNGQLSFVVNLLVVLCDRINSMYLPGRGIFPCIRCAYSFDDWLGLNSSAWCFLELLSWYLWVDELRFKFIWLVIQ